VSAGVRVLFVLSTAVIDRRYRLHAVCVFGRVEAALLAGHVAPDVIEDVARGLLEDWLARDLERLQIADGELRLIVEHFLEMRNVPELVHGVTVKAATEMIVDAAFGHLAQRGEGHLQRPLPFL